MAKRKARLSHVPALDDARLQAALQTLELQPISARAKRELAAILRAAQNPDAESPENVIKALEPERKRNVEATMSATRAVTEGIMSRGGARLMAMSEAEFDELLRAANADAE